MAQQARVQRTVPANGVFADALQGQPLRFIRTPGIIQLGVTVPAAGAGGILIELIVGGRSVASSFVANTEASAGAGPLEDRDFFLKSRVQPGDEVLVNLTNTTAGAIVATVAANLPTQE